MKKIKDKKIQDKFDKVKSLIKSVDDTKSVVVIIAQTPWREKMGLPPMEIVNTLEAGLDDLDTISQIHKKNEEVKNGI